jgi:hypothetical protein
VRSGAHNEPRKKEKRINMKNIERYTHGGWQGTEPEKHLPLTLDFEKKKIKIRRKKKQTISEKIKISF